MKYSIDNLNLLRTESFHDYAISEIKCDYDNHVVTIPLSEKAPPYLFNFFGVKHLSVSIDEPWGEGVYVSDIYFDTEINKEGVFNMVLLINSGDKIEVTCTDFEFEQK